MPTETLAIDVHAHYGNFNRRNNELVDRFMTGDTGVITERARAARTRLSIVSPLLGLIPRGEANAAEGNEEAIRLIPEVEELMLWVIIDPQRPETYEQAEEILPHPKCAGIKIHPEEHCYPITEHASAIFEFAAARRAVVLTHSGEERSLPEDFVPFADAHPEVTLILAHLGCGYDGDPSHQVRAIQQSRRGNMYVDTSSQKSIMPGLIEWAAAEIGPDRLLYGTDTPLYFAPMQRARIDEAELTDKEKRMILCENAERLLASKLEGQDD